MSARLTRFPSFAAWSAAELDALEARMTLQAVPKGHVFVHEGKGEAAELALFALVKGQAQVSRKGAQGSEDARFTLDEGSLFGVVAFVDGGARSATVSAAGDSEVLVLSREVHATLDPVLAARLELVIARQLARDFASMNRRAVAAFTDGAPPAKAGPSWLNVQSYSGLHAMRTELHPAGSVREMVATLAAARKQGRRVVVRGAGLSFDTQSMYGDLTLRLDGFNDVTIDAEARTLTVGAGACWGDVLPQLEARGFMTPIMVSGMGITVGGTIGVNALSRFSPVWGKEGKSLESLEVLTVSGDRLTVSRTREPDLFHGVVGGLGQLAVVLRATYRLLPLGTPLRVESRVERTADPSRLAPALTLAPDASPRAQTSYAVVAFKGDEVRSIITRSRYVNDVPLRTLLPHRPANVSRVPIELAIHHFQSMGQAFWNFAYERYLDDAVTYVDELSGYTFFMDGNARTKRAAESLGIAFRTLQETYLLPRSEQLTPFILKARAMTAAAGLELALVDVLYLSEDEPFCLSSTNGVSGFAVTFTFEGLDDVSQLGRARELFVDLATESMVLGGRVHLTKNVFARPGDVSRMYRPGLEKLIAAKRKYDPFGLLTSDFAQRLFPELAPG
jgi:decaprenylphospho-beta-D-ribofuranose 2-oxidase